MKMSGYPAPDGETPPAHRIRVRNGWAIVVSCMRTAGHDGV